METRILCILVQGCHQIMEFRGKRKIFRYIREVIQLLLFHFREVNFFILRPRLHWNGSESASGTVPTSYI